MAVFLLKLFILISCLLSFSISSHATKSGFKVSLTRDANAARPHSRHSKKKHHTAHGYEAPASMGNSGMVMEISLGTPGQSFKAVVDTGSDLTWVKLKTNCSNTSQPTFSVQESTTYQPIAGEDHLCGALSDLSFSASSLVSCDELQCAHAVTYGSGNIFAYLGNDTISLKTVGGSSKDSGSTEFRMLMGLVTATSTGINYLEGIIGLGQGKLSLATQLGDAIQHKFSYCFVDDEHSNVTTPLFFGEIAELHGRSSVKSTPILPNGRQECGYSFDTYYKLNLTKIRMGGEEFQIDPDTVTVIDSGTTISELTSDTYSAIYDYFNSRYTPFINIVTYVLAWGSPCYNQTGHGELQPMFWEFEGGASIKLEVHQLISRPLVIPYNISEIFCLTGVYETTGPLNIWGNNFQQNLHILYDRNASMLSFAETKCHKLVVP